MIKKKLTVQGTAMAVLLSLCSLGPEHKKTIRGFSTKTYRAKMEKLLGYLYHKQQ